MQKLKEMVEQWRKVEPELVSLGRIKTDPKYQPRDPRLAPFKDRGRLESASQQHIEDMAARLGDGRDLEPLLVASIDGKLWLIDGHHRLQAYRREGRSSVPVRALEVTQEAALMVSKAVNCDGTKLPMHDEQKREAAWQYLGMVTSQGKTPLPTGVSLREIGRMFGTSKDTTARMHQQLQHITRDDFSLAACDPGTDWPQWRHVKGNAIRDRFADTPEDRKDAQRAAKIAAMIDKDGQEAFLRSICLLEQEAVTEAVERLAEATDEADDY